MSFVSPLARRFLRYFWQRSDICAILFLSDILEQIVFIPSGFEHSSGQGFFFATIFPFDFSIFFEKRRFWRAKPGGRHVGGFPPRRARCFPKKIFREMKILIVVIYETFCRFCQKLSLERYETLIKWRCAQRRPYVMVVFNLHSLGFIFAVTFR